MTARLVSVLCLSGLLLGGCVGKHKALCIDLHEGSNAHIKIGYLYDSTEMTVTGPMRITTTPEDMARDTCARLEGGT